jgi:type II secretory ATPase GspE/PulE/Tfp pilus assembly ATPase PilB-like protein/ActR/RegA family two-component response regulator
MTGVSSHRQHWLSDVLRRANVPGTAELDIRPDASIEDAWQSAAAHCNLTTAEIAGAVGRAYGFPVANLSSAENRALRLVPEATARKYHVLPLRESDRQLVVATANPNDFDAEQNIGFSAGRNVAFEIAGPAAITAALDDSYSPNLVVEALLGKLDAGGGDNMRVMEEPGDNVAQGELSAGPIVRLVSLIIEHAIRERASDVHIEPGPAGGHVRIRVDGVMQSALQMPMSLVIRVVSRIKILGKLDIADRHRPQDGRARVQVGQRQYDLRISTVPTRDAEKVVIRILDPSASPMLETLGIPAPELAKLRQLLSYREGIIIVTGPTGSGKSTTLYSLVRELSTGAINIMTVEDPVEYELAGVTQIQVEPKRNVTFASALRAMLRQDPDVIYVGEIRDAETAEIAAQAAMTGHLVVASLHTNDAVGVVPRLRDLGLPAVTIATVLRGAVGQRLVRKLCPHCSEPIGGKMSREEQMLADRQGVTPVRRAVGCKRCNGTGYRGRAAVAEVLMGTTEFADAINRGVAPSELDAIAKAGGMRPIRKAGADLVAEGITTVQELDRVVGSDATAAHAAAAQDAPHVLVIDDDELIRTLARALLEKAGMKVTEAEDGEQALAHLERGEEFSMVLLDLDMPKLSGMDVLKAIRSKLTTAGLPVVILTGSEAEQDEIRVMDAGADDYVRKPIVPDRLLTRIKSVLRRAGS